MKRASISQEEWSNIKKNGSRLIYSLVPIDKPDCDCYSLRQDWAMRMNKMPLSERKGISSKKYAFHCPRAKGKKKYQIFCGNCGDLLAEVWADNDRLDDWCDLHYISQSKIDEEKEEVIVLDRYQKNFGKHKKGEVKLGKNGEPQMKTLINIKKSGKWHGALAVNVNGNYPIIECACLKRNGFTIINSDIVYKIKHG